MSTLVSRLAKLEAAARPVNDEPRRIFKVTTSPSRQQEAKALMREMGCGERPNDLALLVTFVSPEGEPEWDGPIEIQGPD